jgi:hypothetical protein
MLLDELEWRGQSKNREAFFEHASVGGWHFQRSVRACSTFGYEAGEYWVWNNTGMNTTHVDQLVAQCLLFEITKDAA